MQPIWFFHTLTTSTSPRNLHHGLSWSVNQSMSKRPYSERVSNEYCVKPTTIFHTHVKTISKSSPNSCIELAQGSRDRLPKSKRLRKVGKMHAVLTKEIESLSEQLKIKISSEPITSLSDYDDFFGKVLSNVMSIRSRDNIREIDNLLTEGILDSFAIKMSAVLFAKLYANENKVPFERERSILKDNKRSSFELEVKNLKLEIQKLNTQLAECTRRRTDHDRGTVEEENGHGGYDDYKRRHVSNKSQKSAKRSNLTKQDVIKTEHKINTIQELYLKGSSENAPIEVDEIPEDQVERMMKSITTVPAKDKKEDVVPKKQLPNFRSFESYAQNGVQKDQSANLRHRGSIGSRYNVDIPEEDRHNGVAFFLHNEKVREPSTGSISHGFNFSIFKGEEEHIAKSQDVLFKKESISIISRNRPSPNSETTRIGSYLTLNRSGMLPRLPILHKGDRPIFRGPLSDLDSSTDDTDGESILVMDQHES